MNSRTRGLLDIHLAVALFGLAGLFGKFLDLPSSVIVFGRTAIAGLGLWLIIRLQGCRIAPASGRDLVRLAALGGLLALHWWCFFYSIQISSVMVGLISYSTFPIFVTFLEPVWFREKLRLMDVFFAILVFAGLTLIVPSLDIHHHVFQGVLWGTLSGLTFAVLSILNRKMVQVYPPLIIAWYQNSFAALWLVFWIPGAGSGIDMKQIVLLILLGLGCTALAHTLFISSLATIRTQLASLMAGLEPVYGLLFALIFLGEIPSLRILAGGAIILLTNFSAVRYHHRKSPAGELPAE